jgi:hypothetical protein
LLVDSGHDRAELVELTAERDALRAQLAGDLPAATRWLQRKVWRQAAELDRLNRRVASQRFVLRTLDGLGRSRTVDEYRTARNAVRNAAASKAERAGSIPARGTRCSKADPDSERAQPGGGRTPDE